MKAIFTGSFLLYLITASFISLAQPSNDECTHATVVTIPASGRICLTSSNVGADSTTFSGNSPCNINPWPSDVWFTFISTGTLNTITVKQSGASPAKRLGMTVQVGSCNTLQGVGSFCEIAANSSDSVQIIQVNSIGTQFFVQVSSFTGDGTFDLCINSINPPPSPGQSCDSATNICDLSSFNLVEEPLGSVTDTPACFLYGAPNTTWYKFTVNASGILAWLCTPTADTVELDWALYDITNGCTNLSGTELGCNYHFASQMGAPIGMSPTSTTICPIDSANTNFSEEICPSLIVSAGHTYAIIISNYNSYGTGWNFNWAGSTFQIAPTFTVSPTTICGVNGTINITYNDTGVVSQTWDFGDATTDTSSHPGTHFYSQPGVYNISLTTTSVSGCSNVSSKTVTITPLPIDTTVTNVSCFGAADGKVFASPTGVQPFTYAWSANAATGNVDSAINLGPGTYGLTVTDSTGCIGKTSVPVNQPATAVSVTAAITNVACKGDSTGLIALIPVGGTGTYTYTWNTTATTQSISNLKAGNYSVTVYDINLCSVTRIYQVTQPALALQFQNPTVVNVLCHDSATGSITMNVIGGTAPYNYSWSHNNQLNSAQATGLAAATYFVTVTDSSHCAASDSATISQPSAITFGASTIQNTSCSGTNNGSATVTPSGGTGTYTYTWNGVAGSNPETGLAGGNYIVVITDGNNCQASTSVSIGASAQMLLSTTVENVLCSGAANGAASVGVSGGTPPFDYLWSTQDTSEKISSLAGGTYLVTVTDNNLCSATISAFVSEPTPLVSTMQATAVKCRGDADGIIIVSSSGATPPYDYSATLDGVNFSYSFNDTIMGLTAGSYNVILSDNNGCTKTDTLTVPDATPDVFFITTDSTTCFGPQYKNGAIHINDTLINSPHQYSLDSGQFQYSGDFYNIGAGVHHILAKNAFNCDTVFSVTVGEPAEGIATILPADTTVQLGQPVQLTTTFTPYPASTIVSYNWAPSLGLSCIDCPNPIAAPYTDVNNYMLTIIYNQNCLANASATVIETNQAKVFIPNSFTPNGDGSNDVFQIYGQAIKVLDLKIFNRWGMLVYQSNNAFNGWDGTYKGTFQSPGVYSYAVKITFLDDTTLDRQGSVTLLR